MLGSVLLVSSLASCGGNTPEPFDLIVRGGLVYDGTGSPGQRVDIGVRGDRIIQMGDLAGAQARDAIDASGLAVAPGFINMLSWATLSLLHDGTGLSDLAQGVTLEVFGEGTSMGPLNQAAKDRLAEASPYPIEIDWTSLGEYLESLERRGVAMNVASFVGATTVRTHVLGFEDRAPTDEELGQMREVVREAMLDGAMGVGSSLIYPPAFFATTEELIALCEVAAEYGGRYISHLRSEGDRLEEGVGELLRIAREADIGAEIYHLKAGGESNWHKLDAVLAMIEQARADGLAISTNMYLYTAGATGLTAGLPPWSQDGGFEALLERLRDPRERRRIEDEMQIAGDWENLLLAAGSASNVLLVGFQEESLRHLIGKTLEQVAVERGTSPEATVLDLILEDESRVEAVYFLMSEENVARQVQLPYMSFGSDAGAMAPVPPFTEQSTHPRGYGNFARLLGRYVRDQSLVPLEEAIRRLTSLPASNLGLRDRGLLVAGAYADLVIFDPETVRDTATFEEPHQLAVGVRDVVVNGVPALRDGAPTGNLPGRAVRGPGWRGHEEGH